ncbi:3-keto-5-aminohexanoate cleavage protein [Granulosicoccus sp.]|nr:3-keto-5-aminohexanoate cleavage protein [Granulosicoccus sp.]MDB4222643.1 3-keto-5-aminohexanoate cleavage protein [Granulosicoccus sp.]
MKSLPQLMVAPNGARKTKADHKQLPITIAETVATAKACYKAGADAIHLHVRNTDGSHSLDSDLYREAMNQLAVQVPHLAVQITTEAVGQYTPDQQRQVIKDTLPDYVSISLTEMLSGDLDAATDFYRWCTEESISVQHILYGQDDLDSLEIMLAQGNLSKRNLQLLFVLGRYTTNQVSDPEDLTLFTQWLAKNDVLADWAVCAFGMNETRCLEAALHAGGKIRVGFENSFWNHDGSLAEHNAERVAEIRQLIDRLAVNQ